MKERILAPQTNKDLKEVGEKVFAEIVIDTHDQFTCMQGKFISDGGKAQEVQRIYDRLKAAQRKRKRLCGLNDLITLVHQMGHGVEILLIPLMGSGLNAIDFVRFTGKFDKGALLRLMLRVHKHRINACDQHVLMRVRSSTLKEISKDRSRINYPTLIRFFAAAGYEMHLSFVPIRAVSAANNSHDTKTTIRVCKDLREKHMNLFDEERENAMREKRVRPFGRREDLEREIEEEEERLEEEERHREEEQQQEEEEEYEEELDEAKEQLEDEEDELDIDDDGLIDVLLDEPDASIDDVDRAVVAPPKVDNMKTEEYEALLRRLDYPA
ncbi:MAG: hypothetical protein IAF58_03140 [Leptolyngbya sp.]|nr:hypothetical protein [Candidatus Melainabacteria bacterium]